MSGRDTINYNGTQGDGGECREGEGGGGGTYRDTASCVRSNSEDGRNATRSAATTLDSNEVTWNISLFVEGLPPPFAKDCVEVCCIVALVLPHDNAERIIEDTCSLIREECWRGEVVHHET
jgi:hypothetical protein